MDKKTKKIIFVTSFCTSNLSEANLGIDLQIKVGKLEEEKKKEEKNVNMRERA